jgi:hypothetical protein
MKKITAGHGAAFSTGVKTEAGQIPSGVLMVVLKRGIDRFLE